MAVPLCLQMESETRYKYIGLLGTVAFHLVLLAAFLILKIGEVKTKHEELMTIEISEEPYKPIEEIIKEAEPPQEAIEQLSQQALSNIVSNTAEQMDKEISTEKYIQELMDEMGIEDLTPEHDNSLPDDPSLAPDKKDEAKEDVNTNFGQTRITYNVPPNRKARYIDRPIYRCQGGGKVVVAIQVSPEGNVLQANIKSSSTNDICIHEMAIASAQNFLFERDNTAEKRVDGTITYIFVAQ